MNPAENSFRTAVFVEKRGGEEWLFSKTEGQGCVFPPPVIESDKVRQNHPLPSGDGENEVPHGPSVQKRRLRRL